MIEKIKIKELLEEDRPREKLRKIGANNLTDKELLAIILRTGTKNINVIKLAENILKDVGGVTGLRNATYNELIKHKGMGSVKAIDILASLELAKRIFTNDIDEKITCDNPKVIANYFRYKLEFLKQEIFLVLDINTKGKIIAEREVFKGSLAMSVVHPREVFKEAIKNSSASLICIHNHPSGDATVSVEDIKITQKLIKTGNIVGIDVLDHIIISSKGYCSIRKVISILEKEKIDINEITECKLKVLSERYKLVDNY